MWRYPETAAQISWFCHWISGRLLTLDWMGRSLGWAERPRDPHPFPSPEIPPAILSLSEQTTFRAEMVLPIELRQQEASDYIQVG